MKYSTQPASHCSIKQLLAPTGLLLIAGVLLAVDLQRPSGIQAAVGIGLDTDGDRLVDKQERVLGTLASVTDTDHDGFTDAEELSRNSSPLLFEQRPASNSLSTGLTAHAQRDGLHAVAAVYIPGGNYRDVDIHIGMLVGRNLCILRQEIVASRSFVTFSSAQDPNALVALVDFSFDRSWVSATGHFVLFATVGWRGTGVIAAADAIDLFDIAGTAVLAMPDPFHEPVYDMTNSSTTGPATIYKPLTSGGSDVPAGWVSGEICFQSSQPVGISGALVTHEVVAAACESGWDGACPPSCESSVGSTYTSVDPLVLIGG